MVPQEACADSDTKAGINAGSASGDAKTEADSRNVVGVCICGRIPEGVGEIWLSFYLWEYVEFCLEKGEQKEMLLLTDLLFS